MSKITSLARLWARIDIMMDWKPGRLGFGYLLAFPVIGLMAWAIADWIGAFVAFVLMCLVPIATLTKQHITRPKSDLASPVWLDAAIWITKPNQRAMLIAWLDDELTKNRPLTRATVLRLMHELRALDKANADTGETEAVVREQQQWLQSLLERLKG